MGSKHIGRQTVRLADPPQIAAFAAVGGKMEGEGPLAACFDYLSADSHFGAKSWESAESEMLRRCFTLLLSKAAIEAADLDYVFTGDLLNQCVGTELNRQCPKAGGLHAPKKRTQWHANAQPTHVVSSSSGGSRTTADYRVGTSSSLPVGVPT